MQMIVQRKDHIKAGCNADNKLLKKSPPPPIDLSGAVIIHNYHTVPLVQLQSSHPGSSKNLCEQA